MSRDVIADLDSMIAEHSMLKHPFYQAWTAGTLTPSGCRTMPSSTIRTSPRFRVT
jgi:pyrroloquinoline quinone (PQQ) biosynthesis protein C